MDVFWAPSIELLVLCVVYRMRYVAAYLLAVLGGNDSPSAVDIKYTVYRTVGIVCGLQDALRGCVPTCRTWRQ